MNLMKTISFILSLLYHEKNNCLDGLLHKNNLHFTIFLSILDKAGFSYRKNEKNDG